MLAIPTEIAGGTKAACAAAVAATDEALAAVDAWNGALIPRGEPEVGVGIVMHVGNVSFGNVATTRRLDFTVIGRLSTLPAGLSGCVRRWLSVS